MYLNIAKANSPALAFCYKSYKKLENKTPALFIINDNQ